MENRGNAPRERAVQRVADPLIDPHWCAEAGLEPAKASAMGFTDPPLCRSGHSGIMLLVVASFALASRCALQWKRGLESHQLFPTYEAGEMSDSLPRETYLLPMRWLSRCLC